MLKDLRKILDYYLNEYEIADGYSEDYYCDESLVHPMGVAKYILTLCSLYRSGLLSHSKLIQKTKNPVKQLYERKISIENTEDIFWGLGYKYQNLEKNEPFLITTAIVAQSLLELNELVKNDLFINNFSKQILRSIEHWVINEKIYCKSTKILVPKYSPNLQEPIFNSSAYAYSLILKYSLDEKIKIEAENFMNLLWEKRLYGIGWKYSYSSNVVDLLHVCYIQNSYFISGSKINEENRHELISMINQFNYDSYFMDALFIKNSFDEWKGNIFRSVNKNQYIELKSTKARLWSIGELLVVLSNMLKINNDASLEKFIRHILSAVLKLKFSEKEYFRHTMHYTHGLASILKVIRQNKK